MIAFATPTNTVIPTVHTAVEEVAKRHKPFVPFLSNRDVFLRHLYEFRKIVDELWQGRCHLRHENVERGDQLAFEQYTIVLDAEWLALIEAAYEDASDCGVSREEFIVPYMQRMKPWRGVRCEPPAEITISRALGGQFSLHDDPVIFLMRQLACRITMAAYANCVSTAVKSRFFDRLRNTSLPQEWRDTDELKWAAALYKGEHGTEHHSFGYLMIRELGFMTSLFELMFRQMQEPIT